MTHFPGDGCGPAHPEFGDDPLPPLCEGRCGTFVHTMPGYGPHEVLVQRTLPHATLTTVAHTLERCRAARGGRPMQLPPPYPAGLFTVGVTDG